MATNNLIKKIIYQLNKNVTCIPYVVHNDLVKIKKNIELDKEKIKNIQTPQGFNFKYILHAHRLTKKIDAKDDSTLIEDMNIKLKLIRGEITNLKITNKEDLKYFDMIRKKF